MTGYELKYGLNPDRKPAEIFIRGGGELPFEVKNGRAGYINLLDALNGWQLVRELKRSLGLPAAASFKHVSPAGAAIGVPLTGTLERAYFADSGLSPLAAAYVRARGADRLCSYGDFIALSDVCDIETAGVISPEVSDGVIAPGFDGKALELLRAKRKGTFVVIEIDPDWEPNGLETRDVFGVTFSQGVSGATLDAELLCNEVTSRRDIPQAAKRDLLLAMITLKYTQSNSVCVALDGQAIGVGAGQQSRLHCVRLACAKADNWRLRQHPKALSLPWRGGLKRPERDNALDAYIAGNREADELLSGWERFFTRRPEALTEAERVEWTSMRVGASLASDAFFPFADSIVRAFESGIEYIAQPGGSVRDGEVIAEADRRDMAMAFTGVRLFWH